MDTTALLDLIGNAAEQFLEAKQRELYRSGAGYKATPDLAPIYQQFADLLSPDTIAALLINSDDATEEAMAFRLREFLTREYIQAGLIEVEDSLDRAEAALTVSSGDETLSYGELLQTIAITADPARRHELDRARRKAEAKLNPQREQRLHVLKQRAGELGYPSYESLLLELDGEALESLRDMQDALLERTEAAYMTLAEDYLEDIGLDLAYAEQSDLLAIFAALERPGDPGQHDQQEVLRETLRGLGIALDDLPNLTLDAAARSGKKSQPLCYAVRVPAEVYLRLDPQASGADRRAALFATGQALYSASVDPTLHVAFRQMGDGTLAEAYAALLQHLATDADWLEHFGVLSGHELYSYLRLACFHDLYLARTQAALLLFEEQLHQDDADHAELAAEYADRMSRALGVRCFHEDYLSSRPDGFSLARRATGAILGAMLHSYLRDRFGPTWFADKDAGALLRQFYARGASLDAATLSTQLGFPGLDPEPLLNELLADALED